MSAERGAEPRSEEIAEREKDLRSRGGKSGALERRTMVFTLYHPM